MTSPETAPQQLSRSLFDQALDPMCLVDDRLTLVDVNAAACELLGHTRDALMGRSIQILLPDSVDAEALYRELIAQGRLRGQYPVRRSDGTERMVEVSAVAHVAPGLHFGSLRDVTARVEAERALQRSESRLRALIEKSAEGISIIDAEGIVRFASPSAARILGVTSDALVGKRFDLFVHPDDRERALSEHAGLAAGGPENWVEFRVLRADGAVRWLEGSGRPMLDDPNIRGVVGNFRDITDRKRLAQERERILEALRESEHRYRRIVDNASEGILMYDAAGTITFMNPSMAAMLRCSIAEGMGQSVFSFLPTEAKAEARERLVSAGREADDEGNRGQRERLHLVRADGTDLWVSVNFDPLWDESGHFESALVMVSDVTEWHRSQQALKRSEEQLRQAQKMEAIGSLAGGIAHDFNNLLSVVLSYSSLVINDLPPGDQVREDVEQIHEAGVRASELTRQLLAFGRKQVLQPEPLDVNEVLTGLEALLSRMVREDVQVRIVTAPDVGNVIADWGQLEQVLINLAVNARDAMPDGGSLIFETSAVSVDAELARSHPGLKPGPHVRLSVTDTGIGMDSATRERIFEPFYTTKDVGKGTGLGLSTVYGIVQQSDGAIFVDSEPGRGTTFEIYLPQTTRPARSSASSLQPPEHLEGDETILLVEDEPQVRALTVGILHRHGYHVLEAQNAGEALLLSEQFDGRIHLLLSDVVMPHMHGPQLAERLVQMRPEMQVLLMSGYTDDAAVRAGVLDGNLDFLSKPVMPTTLLAKVRELLDRGSNPDA